MSEWRDVDVSSHPSLERCEEAFLQSESRSPGGIVIFVLPDHTPGAAQQEGAAMWELRIQVTHTASPNSMRLFRGFVHNPTPSADVHVKWSFDSKKKLDWFKIMMD